MSKVTVRDRNRNTERKPNWEYRFDIAKIDGKRKRISKSGFRTKKEAINAGVKALAEYNSSGTVIDESNISFSDYLDLYVEKYCKQQLNSQTVSGYEKKIRLYIKPVLGMYKLSAINPIAINDFLKSMIDNGYSRNTIISCKGILSGAFTYAVSPLKLIQSSPMINVKIPKYSDAASNTASTSNRIDGKRNGAVKGNNPHIYLSKDNFNRILERFPEGHPAYIPLIIGYHLGTRIAETYALTFEDIDFTARTISINKQVQWNPDLQSWYFKPPKYNSVRTISADDFVLNILHKQLEIIKANAEFYDNLYCHYYIDENEVINSSSGTEIHLINVRENGTFVNPRTMQHCSRVIHSELGINDFDYHSLRHTHSTDLAIAGANMKFIQNRLGHKSIKVTLEVYQHITEQLEEQGRQLLNEMY